ncbi:MAG: AAR2 pre-mRNA splicing protein, partial [Candidatus Heimdallarchaeota archaeon]
MFGYILLRDIPKKEAQLDLSIFAIQGGFRGFTDVEPGIHFVTVKDGEEMHEGFWCFVRPNGVVVKILDYETNKFMDCKPEDEQRYQMMATSGAMNHALISVKQKDFARAKFWKELTDYIQEEQFTLELNLEEPMQPPANLTSDDLEQWYLTTFKSRFQQAFYDTHKGNANSFLQEFQLAYAKYLVNKDTNAYNRWRHLLQAIYNAGEDSINKAVDLFSRILTIIQKQFNAIKVEDFTPES